MQITTKTLSCCGFGRRRRPLAQLAERETGQLSRERRTFVANGHVFNSPTNFYLGAFAAARAHAEQAIQLYDEAWAEARREAVGLDFLCAAHVFLALPAAVLGEVEFAAQRAAFALQRAKTLDQVYSIANIYSQDLPRLLLADRPTEAHRHAEALNAIVSTKGIRAWDLSSRLYVPWALGCLSNPGAGIEGVRVIWSEAKARGAGIYDTSALFMLADLAVRAGRVEEALNRS